MCGKGGQGVFKGELRPKVELCFENLLDQIANFGRLVFVTLTFHIAHLNRHIRKILGVLLKMTWCQGFGVQSLPKSGNPDSCTPKF